MARKSHKNPDIESAIQYAEDNDWEFVESGKSAHAWGKLRCPNNDKACRCGDFCQNSIWGTPKNPTSHARAIRRWVDGCTGSESEGE